MTNVTAIKLLNDGMERRKAELFWDDISGFASYSFNRSHSVEYSLIAFQAAYLKAHYPVEFYCAQMGTTKDDKLAVLAKKAAEDGIRIIPPDINISTNQDEPLNDIIIAAPLSAIMNVSAKGVEAIMAARASSTPTVISTTTGRGAKKVTTSKTYGPGRFISIEDFQARVPARAVNARAVEHLNRVGAFARIEPDQLPSTHPSRQKDQIELMPALADQGVMADREIEMDEIVFDTFDGCEARMKDELGPEAVPCFIGREPKIMFILDAPLNDIDALPRQFSYQQFIEPSLREAGLSIEDGVWTWLLRRPLAKGERFPPDDQIVKAQPYLAQEVALMKPPVIVLLGNAVVKQFFPDIKKPNEAIGHKAFSAKLDATIIVGFKPTQIYHDAAKADVLKEIFAEAKRLIEDIA